jgi:cell wall-associated NlpC family hydrolase
MGDQEASERAAVCAEARRWTGTPYHDQGDTLGGGVDCGMSLVRWFCDSGLIEPFDPRPYPADWMLHQDGERYLDLVRSLARHEYDPRARPPPAGDVVVWRFGRTFSHGGLVTGAPGTLRGWPWIVHAYAEHRVVEETDAALDSNLMWSGRKPRPMLAFSYWSAP